MTPVMTPMRSLDEVVLTGDLPPLVLIAFTRPELLTQVLDAVAQQTLFPPKVIAFVDGARHEDDQRLIDQCVTHLKAFSASTSIPVHIIARTQNLGCDQNVIQGLTDVLSTHDSLVYLEDDTLPNPYFYDRMCRLLEVYRHIPCVCSVSGYASVSSEWAAKTDTDVIPSSRVFCWGFGTWADRWNEIDLMHQPAQHNPFGHFYAIPLTAETKMTLANQFWLEHNQKTDWVITFTLMALYLQKVHIVPVRSLTFNIGFGHPQSKTYKGQEQPWVNDKYDKTFCPNHLPITVELPQQAQQSLTDLEFAQYFSKHQGLWLKPSAFFHFLKHACSINQAMLLIKVFITRLPLIMQRWRRGLSI
ncbi:MAG: glycosyltransferase [Leptolyngbyaceae bacterium]|nr:glycosyltransferase [Leptolyngbyaceae bacterium]